MSPSRRDAYLRRTYGVTEEWYENTLALQGNGCAICGKTREQEGKNLAVDHNHKTGEVRGILCSYCNHRRIGRHTDSELLQKMADYLKTLTGLFVPPKPKKKKRKSKKK